MATTIRVDESASRRLEELKYTARESGLKITKSQIANKVVSFAVERKKEFLETLAESERKSKERFRELLKPIELDIGRTNIAEEHDRVLYGNE